VPSHVPVEAEFPAKEENIVTNSLEAGAEIAEVEEAVTTPPFVLFGDPNIA
jgi:hypothetical protein